MAKTNKYTTINFNHIYDKSRFANPSPSSNNTSKPTKNPSSSFHSYTSISYPKAHGRMLVLTRPTPKPITTPPPKPLSSQLQQSQSFPDQARSQPYSDHISLRPLGRTDTGSPIFSTVPRLEKEKDVAIPVTSSKPNKFVPPHLRPGFEGREERPGLELGKRRELSRNNFRSPGQYGEDQRPKSGGGYERMTGGGDSDLGMVSQPRSRGYRPSSSG
ncbi:hypothetical protein I3843_03G177000 [Carya illinoinensis]|nr:hypothetical protein I3843_03G177000 [Carya illinoinensis]